MGLSIAYLIDHLESNYPRDQNYIIKYMMEQGHNIIVFTSLDRKFSKYDKVFFANVDILRAPVIFKIGGAHIYISWRIFSKILNKYDIVHSFTFFTFSSLLGTAMKPSAKIIRSEIGPPDGATFKKAQGIYSILTKLYKNAYSYFTAYNDFEVKSLELLGINRKHIILLPPMIDYKKFANLEKRSDSSSINIGMIARLTPEKGVHRTILIIKEVLKNIQTSHVPFKFFLAGRVDKSDYALKILKTLRSMLGSSFIYLGEVAPPYDFYRLVDVVLVPSYVETGAITVVEAMAAGKIVLGSNIYPINLYISHGKNGFLFNGPPDAAKIIIDILSGIININSITREAQNYAKRHDYKIVCRKLENVYKMIASK